MIRNFTILLLTIIAAPLLFCQEESARLSSAEIFYPERENLNSLTQWQNRVQWDKPGEALAGFRLIDNSSLPNHERRLLKLSALTRVFAVRDLPNEKWNAFFSYTVADWEDMDGDAKAALLLLLYKGESKSLESLTLRAGKNILNNWEKLETVSLRLWYAYAECAGTLGTAVIKEQLQSLLPLVPRKEFADTIRTILY